jgi:hypothetical protein
LALTTVVVAASAAIVTPLWLVATRMRSLYNILLICAFAIGVGWMIVRRVRRQAEETDLRTALSAAGVAAARLVGWVATLAAAPLFVLALVSTGATLPAVILIVIDLGAIGILLTSGRRSSADRSG